MLSLILTTTAALVGAGPDSPKSKPVEFTIRVCRGDPKGSVEAKTIEVLSRPTITTILNRPAYVFNGREVAVVRGGVVEYVPLGLKVQMTPKSIDKRTAEVEVAFEDSRREGTPPVRAAMSGRVSRGEPVRLFLQTPPGEPQMWAEIVVPKEAR
jgi:hypothetical protein